MQAVIKLNLLHSLKTFKILMDFLSHFIGSKVMAIWLDQANFAFWFGSIGKGVLHRKVKVKAGHVQQGLAPLMRPFLKLCY